MIWVVERLIFEKVGSPQTSVCNQPGNNIYFGKRVLKGVQFVPQTHPSVNLVILYIIYLKNKNTHNELFYKGQHFFNIQL